MYKVFRQRLVFAQLNVLLLGFIQLYNKCAKTSTKEQLSCLFIDFLIDVVAILRF